MEKKKIYKNATRKKIVPQYTNSGAVVFREILGKDKKEENLSDFSNFPVDGEKIEGIRLEQISSCGFNNVVSAYYSKTQLSEEFGINDISLLRNKFITYAIVTDNGKWYFGSTNDFGERINTWLKDFRGFEMSQDRERVNDNPNNEEMSSDARKYKRVLFICLAISKTKQVAKEKENELIRKFVKKRFKEITNGENPENYTKKQVFETVQSFIYNKINAIAY